MSRIYIGIICFLFLMDYVNGQVVYERTFPFEFPSIQFPIELSDTSTFSLGTNNECGGIGSRHIDKSGNELEDHAFWAEAFSSGIYWIGHDSVLIWAEEGANDVGPDSFRVYIWTPEENRKILSSDIRNQFSNSRQYGAFLYSPGRLVFEKTDTLYTINLQNDQVDDSLIIPGISLIIEFEKSILVFSETGDAVLLDDQLTEIDKWQDTTSLPFSINEASVLDSFLVGRSGLDSNALAIINVYNETQREIDLSPYLDLIEDVQVNKNQLFVKGVLSKQHYVIQLDVQLQVVEIHKIDFPDLNIDLTYRYFPDRVYAWGLDGLAKYNANYRISYKYTDPYPVEYVDIALDTMWVDSIDSHIEYYRVVYFSAVVSNHSSQSIHSYTIHYELIPEWWCDQGVYGGVVEDRTILPSTADTISLSLFTYPFGTIYTQRFYIHNGNHHLDDDPSNNSFVLMHVVTSSEDVLSLPHNVYPNPFTNTLYAQEGADSADMKLYTLEGKLVAAGTGHLENLDKLAPGMYILHALTSKGLQVNKVVKSE